VEKKVTPKVTKKVKPKVTPKVTKKVKPKVTPKVTKKVKPKVTPKVTKKVTPKVTPKVTKKVTPIAFFKKGKNYFIRTVTHHHCGTYVGETDHNELVLSNASWIASDGRVTNAIQDGVFDEVELLGDGLVLINRIAIIDAIEWKHPVPDKQK
jgi:hypothetical protein